MDIAAIKSALRTVVVIPITPFTADGAVDYAAYRRLLERLIAGGFSVITINGNASEYYSLTPDEARRLLDETLAVVAGRAIVLTGVGQDAAGAARAARHAQLAGAQGLMIHQPVHPFRSLDGWVAYHQQVAEAAPDLAVVPYVRDAGLNAAALTALLDACPNVAGVKYAVNDPLLFSSLLADVGADRMAWICGVAELWAPYFWAGGAQGFTSGLANVRPQLALDMLRSLQTGDAAGARRAWALARPFEAMRARHSSANNVSVIKEALVQLGVCGRAVRPPISELPPAERAEVTAILARWGLTAPAA
ncbi:MAG: dihydrodipicolinate synthase family protein [Anaerolineales bacterium]|nr:dihydrodipicolinate synthase family protein [Anaerolineales bacterium]